MILKRMLFSLVIFISSTCRQGSDPPALSIMIPPWFAPDESHRALAEAFSRYDSTSPGMPLDIRYGPGKSNLLLQKILLMGKENRLPDIILYKTAWTADLIARGILRPFPASPGDSLRRRLMPELVDLVYRHDSLYAAPYDLDIRLIHYRRDLFESLGIPLPDTGWTQAECFTAAARLTADTNGNGQIDRWGLGVPAARSLSSIAQLLPVIWSAGGTLYEDGTWNIVQPPVERALALYRDLKDSLGISPPDLHMLEQSDIFQGMASGRFAMTIGGSWEISMFQRMSPYGRHIAQAPLPVFGETRTVSSTDGWSFGLTTRDTRKIPFAVRFIHILTGDDHQRDKLEELGWLPVVERGIPWVEDILGPEVRYSLESFRSVPGDEGWPEAALSIADALQNVLARDVEPRDALLRARRGMEDRPS